MKKRAVKRMNIGHAIAKTGSCKRFDGSDKDKSVKEGVEQVIVRIIIINNYYKKQNYNNKELIKEPTDDWPSLMARFNGGCRFRDEFMHE